jgi:hypothetical protein
MVTRLRWSVLLLAVVSLAPAPRPGAEASADRLLRAGQSAFDKGDYTRALGLFQEVEPVAADPGQVTFALAATHFRLALAGGEETGRHLAEATSQFRCMLEPTDPRRPQAMLGLGCCLLVRASLMRSHAACEEALRILGECAALNAGEPSAEARRLLHRARLLEWQLVPSPLTQHEQPEYDPEKEKRPPEQDTGVGPQDKNNNTTKSAGNTRPTPATDPTQKPQQSKDGPQGTQAAEGKNPTVPDRDKLPPSVSADEALRELREASKRIQAEQKAFRKSMARPPADGVPDW